MENFKGTPGPWKWNGEDYRGDWGWQILVGPEGQGVVIGEAPQGIFKGLKAHQDVEPELCKTGFNAHENCAPGVHVRYHNAQLIAAAPELLEALKELISGYEDREQSGMFDMLVHGDLIKKANTAIKKALGE